MNEQWPAEMEELKASCRTNSDLLLEKLQQLRAITIFVVAQINLLDAAHDALSDAIGKAKRDVGDAEDTHALWQAANRVPLSAR